MKTQQAPATAEAVTEVPAATEAEAEAEAEAGLEAETEFVPLHEDDYLSEELTEQFGEEIWIHKPTGRPYLQHNDPIRSWAKLPVFDHDDPFLQFLRGEIEL